MPGINVLVAHESAMYVCSWGPYKCHAWVFLWPIQVPGINVLVAHESAMFFSVLGALTGAHTGAR